MPSWTWKQIETMWAHPDWTAGELSEVVGHSEQAVRKQRQRLGRYHRSHVPICCKCDERPVWDESAKARRYGLCKACYLDEERMRLEDEARSVALRQRRRVLNKRKNGV